MSWANTRGPGTDPKYRTAEHRNYRASLVRQLKQDGYLICTADECVFDTRTITNANGNARDGLHAGHEPDGIAYRGPQHNACNLLDAARRANARSRGIEAGPRRWVL
jgi:hypothetical protein